MGYSNFWKLDKIDKIVISFICIVVTFVCVFNTFCFAEFQEQVFLTEVSGVVPSASSHVLVSNDFYKSYYLELDDNYKYSITLSFPFPTSELSSDFRYCFSDSFDVGSPVYNVVHLPNQESLTLELSSGDYEYLLLFFGVNKPTEFTYTIYRTSLPSFSNTVNTLVDTLTTDYLFSVFKNVVPFIGISIVVVLGYFLLSKLIKGVSKMKQR